jgi:hypothetical protein
MRPRLNKSWRILIEMGNSRQTCPSLGDLAVENLMIDALPPKGLRHRRSNRRLSRTNLSANADNSHLPLAFLMVRANP